MKQFTPLKILTFSALSFANFSAFAMEKEEDKYSDMICMLTKEDEKKCWSYEKKEEYKDLILTESMLCIKDFGSGVNFLVHMLNKYLNFTTNLEHISIEEQIEYEKKFHVPGPVLLELIENVLKSKPLLVNKVFNNDYKKHTPLTFVSSNSDIGGYNLSTLGHHLIISGRHLTIYDDKAKTLKLARTKKIVSLLMSYGADFKVKDGNGKTAYNIAVAKTMVRDVLVKSMLSCLIPNNSQIKSSKISCNKNFL